MNTVLGDGLQQHCASWARVLPGRSREQKRVRLGMKLRPLKLTEFVCGLDGRFHTFALVPPAGGGEGPWMRVDLEWRGTDGHGSEWAVYERDVELPGAQLSRAEVHGVAFGVDTNKGTLWLQPYGHNQLLQP